MNFFRVPGITIATDVICGFPTETWEDFEETVPLVEEYKFPSLFINQFYPRPGTPAARMKRLPTEEVPLHVLLCFNISLKYIRDVGKANLFVWKTIQVKKRTREISKVFHSYHPYDHKVSTAFCLFLCSCFFLPSFPASTSFLPSFLPA